MMLGNQNQYSGGANNSVNTNTELWKGFSDDSQLTLSGWNNKLSLKLRPFTGKNSSGLNTYEKESGRIINTALSLDACATLVNAVDNDLVPAMANKVPGRATIIINETANTGSKKILTLDFDGEVLKLIIACNVGEDNKTIPQYQQTYTFKNRAWLQNYDPESGSGVQVSYYAEGRVFLDIIRNFVRFIPIDHHAGKYSEASEYRPASRQMQQPQNMIYAPQQQVQPIQYQQAPLTQGGTFADNTDLPF